MLKKIKAIDEKIFLSIFSYSEKNEKLHKFFKTFTDMSKPVFVLIYSVLLFYSYFYKVDSLYQLILIPLVGLLASISIRKIVKRQRPYKIFNDKILPVKKEGSFPSNHSCSSFLIAFACMYINFAFGICVFFVACLSSISRVFVGIHFPFDILFGFFLALSISFLFLII